MKVIYICRSNVGRSQIAMEFHNQLRNGEADSAGTAVDIPKQKLRERGTSVEVVVAMNEIGIDMSENMRTQLTPELLKSYDQVIVLAETEAIPEYLKSFPGAVFWDIEDISGKSLQDTRTLRDDIRRHIKDYAENLPES